MSEENFILELHGIEAIQFGDFTLKSGVRSPIYMDLRLVISYPRLLRTAASLMWECVKQSPAELLCGVPYTALPIATCMSLDQNRPMILRRREVKAYGMKKQIEGKFVSGQNCLVVEDLITTGSSVLETVAILEGEGLCVTDVVALLDREQGGKDHLLAKGYVAHTVFTLTGVLGVLERHGKVSAAQVRGVREFLG